MAFLICATFNLQCGQILVGPTYCFDRLRERSLIEHKSHGYGIFRLLAVSALTGLPELPEDRPIQWDFVETYWHQADEAKAAQLHGLHSVCIFNVHFVYIF